MKKLILTLLVLSLLSSKCLLGQEHADRKIEERIIRLENEVAILKEIAMDGKAFVLKILATAVTIGGASIVKDVLLLRRQVRRRKSVND